MEEILRGQIEKIVQLTDEEFRFVLSYFTAKSFRKHQYAVQAGSPAPNDHFVVKGLLKSYYVDDLGKSHILQFAMEDWWISEEKLIAGLQKMEYFFMKKTTAGYIALQRRILSLLSQNAEERFGQFMQLYPTLLQRVPKALIASYLGVSRETLSRLSSV